MCPVGNVETFKVSRTGQHCCSVPWPASMSSLTVGQEWQAPSISVSLKEPHSNVAIPLLTSFQTAVWDWCALSLYLPLEDHSEGGLMLLLMSAAPPLHRLTCKRIRNSCCDMMYCCGMI